MSKFELLPGMQVVERVPSKAGTAEEYRVSTFCETDGWHEISCSADNLEATKKFGSEIALNKECA